ncbi:hypothetical protein [Candidatus Odyssella thessalonicensis]|uniref:hypothetical protein n=1 Tax=Candidatus Odyssella thessalonicensis TaxID=84647 RepID=UPI000225A8AE|nr:hypothetical protein [Candidatus Odyssella thessalonicensis]
MLQHFLSSVFIVVGWFSVDVSGAQEAPTDSATQRYMIEFVRLEAVLRLTNK